MNLRGGWALITGTWLSWMQNRGFFFLLAFGWMLPPLIWLFVWYTAASNTNIGGITQGEFVAYYLTLILVNQLTYSQTNWTVGDKIRDGSMNTQLLKPLHPFFHTLADEIAGKVVYMTFVIPVAVLLALILHPTFQLTWLHFLAFLLTLFLAWLLRFFWGYALALFSFWTTRASAFLGIQDALVFLLAGQVAPIALLPGILRVAAQILPFRYMLSFPVELLTDQISWSQFLVGLAYQGGWLAITLFSFVLLWYRGVRHYTAVGG